MSRMYVENGMKVVSEAWGVIVENSVSTAISVCELVLTLLNKSDSLKTGMALIGTLFVLTLSYSLLYHILVGLKTYILPTLVSLVRSSQLKVKYGPWAMVTGSTQGIGKEYAMTLAKQGLNIVLVSRNKQKLDNVANEIRDSYKVDTMTVVADFTNPETISKAIKKVKSANIDLGILVNNVGVLGPSHLPFLELDKSSVKEIITVNILPTTLLCHAFLPDMVARGRGAVINIASVAGIWPMPYLAVYSATKHYVAAFTQAIAAEYSGSGVVIQEVDPGQVQTEMTKMFFPSPALLAPSPAAFAASAVKTVGYSSRTCGWWVHGLWVTLLDSLMPGWVTATMLRIIGRLEYAYVKRNKQDK